MIKIKVYTQLGEQKFSDGKEVTIPESKIQGKTQDQIQNLCNEIAQTQVLPYKCFRWEIVENKTLKLPE